MAIAKVSQQAEGFRSGLFVLRFSITLIQEPLSPSVQLAVDLNYQVQEFLGVLFHSSSGAQCNPTLLDRNLLEGTRDGKKEFLLAIIADSKGLVAVFVFVETLHALKLGCRRKRRASAANSVTRTV